MGRGGAVAAWGRGYGWVLINQRSLFASKPKQSKKHIQNLKIFQQWQRLTAWGFRFGVGGLWVCFELCFRLWRMWWLCGGGCWLLVAVCEL